jgi:hydroxymethylpyrimidine kinase/phosphomethylpyrimidine kinase
MKRSRPLVICSIGSVDPSGAAGLGADQRVYQHLSAVGVVVVAAVTAQNSARVTAAHALPARLVRQELELIWEQVKPDAICIGLLPGVAVIRAVRTFLSGLRRCPPTVIDPVIAASSGRRFLGPRDVRELATLLPLATVVTPNLFEAAALTSTRVETLSQAQAAAVTLQRLGCAVLVKGGHLTGDVCVDILAQGTTIRRFSARRFAGQLRGGGGILAAALAVGLARGLSLERAIVFARDFVRRAHRNAQRIGSGKAQFTAL